MTIEIIRADESHVDDLLPLFNGYREFYEQERDEAASRAYLLSRIRDDDAVIWLARLSDEGARYAGFVLLYPTFDSVELIRIWILHDLYVAYGFRRLGVGRLLMNTASEFCRESGAARLDLATAVDNKRAQALYESLGYERETDFFRYSLDISGQAG